MALSHSIVYGCIYYVCGACVCVCVCVEGPPTSGDQDSGHRGQDELLPRGADRGVRAGLHAPRLRVGQARQGGVRLHGLRVAQAAGRVGISIGIAIQIGIGQARCSASFLALLISLFASLHFG